VFAIGLRNQNAKPVFLVVVLGRFLVDSHAELELWREPGELDYSPPLDRATTVSI
jgi:hypothetical protein